MRVVNAVTVTDAQIIELRLSLAREMNDLLPRSRIEQARAIGAEMTRSWEDAHAEFKVTDVALGRVRRVRGEKLAARARCAEIIKARAGK